MFMDILVGISIWLLLILLAQSALGRNRHFVDIGECFLIIFVMIVFYTHMVVFHYI